MKIAVIGVREIPANRGEIERYCQEFYPRIAARGHQVDLFVRSAPNRQPLFSVGYYRNVRTIALTPLPLVQTGFVLSSAFSTVWASLGNYDVIHFQSVSAAWLAWLARLFSNSKIIITAHQLDVNYRPRKWAKVFGWLTSSLERTAIANADRVVVISKTLGKYFKSKYKVTPLYIPNAPTSYSQLNLRLDREKLLGLKPQKYILCLEKLSSENQIHLLIRAFQQLRQKGWKLVLAGGVDSFTKYEIELLALAKRNPNIIFLNKTKGERLSQIISNAGLLSVLGDGANLGISATILEAMGKKVPVIASNCRVYQELIGADRGLLFQSGNLDSLSKQLQYVLSQPDAAMTMTQKAHRYVTVHHNWDRVTYGNLSLYFKVTKKLDFSPLQQDLGGKIVD